MKQSLDLLNQIIEHAKQKDLEYRNKMLRKHKASQAVGEDWLVQHLRSLKELIILENVNSRHDRPIQEEE